jgi:HEAT repeats
LNEFFQICQTVKRFHFSGIESMGIYPELDHLGLEGLTQRWHGAPIGFAVAARVDGDEYAIAYYDELAYKICDQGDTDFLMQEVTQADTSRLAAILSHLPAHAHLQTLDYLQDDRPLIVARAIDRLQVEGADVLKQVLSLKSHPSGLVRSSVLRFVSKQAPQSAPPLLVDALQDPDYLVRMSAVDELDELPCVKAIPYIQPLLSDPHHYVREAAVSAIENLSSLLSGV